MLSAYRMVDFPAPLGPTRAVYGVNGTVTSLHERKFCMRTLVSFMADQSSDN